MGFLLYFDFVVNYCKTMNVLASDTCFLDVALSYVSECSDGPWS